jgi:hypothetical protein
MLNMYDVTIPPLKHALATLAANLTIGEAYAAKKKIEPSVMINARLIADMYPLIKQVQIATDMSKGAAARLAGIEIPQYEDNETTFDALQARITKTIAFLDSVTSAQFEGAETREVTVMVRKLPLAFTGLDYLNRWVHPNVYFHCTTAYNIMRENGVDLGKRDFLRLKC